MTPKEFDDICYHIVESTIQTISSKKMKRFQLDRNQVASTNEIYKSAVVSPAPITVIYTPAGTGKTALIKDRIQALRRAGVPDRKMMVLNMNIAKCKTMQTDYPDVNIMTFSDFTHNIYQMNYPGTYLTDIKSIASTLTLMVNTNQIVNDVNYPAQYSDPAKIKEFVQKLSMKNSQEMATLLTCFINNNMDFTIANLNHIHMADYTLESMVCQNMMYYFRDNPYDVDTIMVNGIHNMPVPIVCSLLLYASRYHCNLFITGSPEETIYEFNMASSGSINTISSHNELDVDTIRLWDSQRMQPNIQAFLDMKRNAIITDIHTEALTLQQYESVDKHMPVLMNNNIYDYVKDKFSHNEQVLFLSKNKKELNTLKSCLEVQFKNASIIDLLTQPTPVYEYGSVAAKNLANFDITTNPDEDKARVMFNTILQSLNISCQSADNQYKKNFYQSQIDELANFKLTFYGKYAGKVTKYKSAAEFIMDVINLEAELIQQHTASTMNTATIDITGANFIISTIHSAIDINCDNVVLFLQNYNNKPDDKLVRVALSRANKSEYIVFCNENGCKTPHQQFGIDKHLNVN